MASGVSPPLRERAAGSSANICRPGWLSDLRVDSYILFLRDRNHTFETSKEPRTVREEAQSVGRLIYTYIHGFSLKPLELLE